MRNKRVFPLLLAGLLTVSTGTGVYAAAQDEIADAQYERQAAEAGLEQAQNHIYSLEAKKQELENYLWELDTQYNELTNSVAELGIQAAEKENELKVLKKDLKKAKKTSKKQYAAMKQRIVYMYEKGRTSMLELLLSSGDLAEFLNRAENISQLSRYDRDMLKKYEDLQEEIQTREQAAEEEASSINALMAERSAKQQEVQAMAANTNENIASYISQISASQEEANALRAQIDRADNTIYSLMQQAEQEAAEEAYPDASEEAYEEGTESSESGEAPAEEEYVTEDSGYDEEQEDYTEDSYEEESGSSSSGSGSGTYLGNFTLTAYCNCAQCCGTAGNATASGVMPSAGRTVAMAGVPFGTQLLINGNVYTVEDLGTPYGHVDIYFNSHAEALSFGLQYADVYQL